MHFNIIERPHGPLEWFIDKSHITDFTFIGCLASEDRSTSAFARLLKREVLSKSCFYIINDPQNGFTDNINSRTKENKKILPAAIEYIDVHLLERWEDMKNSFDLCIENNKNIIIDISCFPKRFFFPFIKLAINYSHVCNLIVTYTNPQKYYSEGPLSENYQDWAPLPLFRISPEYQDSNVEEVFFTGAGFVAMRLTKIIESKSFCRILLPFPPGPPHHRRSWDFVQEITQNVKGDRIDVSPIDFIDVAEAFDQIVNATEKNRKKAFFAPYGPKTFSLAMCLYAVETNSPVFYTQPLEYNPEYSIGSRDSYAYYIKKDGKNLYAINR